MRSLQRVASLGTSMSMSRPNCSKHGTLKKEDNGGKKSVCTKCEKLPEEEQGKIETKLERVRLRRSIGVFIRDYYKPFIINKYRKHKWLLNAMYECSKDRDPSRLLFLHGLGQACYCKCDYMDKAKMEFNEESQTEGMGNNNESVGMEHYKKDVI